MLYQTAQYHDGVIIKRQEPYRTILRARPKQVGNRFERFIALADSDPKEVQKRVEETLANKNRKKNITFETSPSPSSPSPPREDVKSGFLLPLHLAGYDTSDPEP
jgi:hypothetical protein